MASCQCQGIASVFSEELAARELDRYRRRGASRTSRMLAEALIAEDLPEGSLLDIGGGVGAIQHLLLEAGMRTATSVEASPAYAAAAARAAQQRGLAQRVEILQGDFVEIAPQVGSHDVVTLDRVVCCYDDMQGLVHSSGARGRRLYGLVIPCETWWVRLAIWLLNAGMRLRRSCFRSYVHPTRQIDAVLAELGYRIRSARRTLFWQVRVYRREPHAAQIAASR